MKNASSAFARKVVVLGGAESCVTWDRWSDVRGVLGKAWVSLMTNVEKSWATFLTRRIWASLSGWLPKIFGTLATKFAMLPEFSCRPPELCCPESMG